MRADRDAQVQDAKESAFAAALRGMPRIVRETPSDRGQARAAWDVRMTPDGAEMYNDAPHIGILEAGSRPHWPPIEPILRWVVRKFGTGLENDAGSKRSFESMDSAQDEVSDEAWAMAWGVAAKIAAEGTEPNWMVRDNLDYLLRLWKGEQERRSR